MSGRSARTIRNFSLELSQDLVLLDIRESTFQHLTVNWNFNVLEMALRFAQDLPKTPLLCFFDISKPDLRTNIFFNIENLKISKIRKPIFPGSLTSDQPQNGGHQRSA